MAHLSFPDSGFAVPFPGPSFPFRLRRSSSSISEESPRSGLNRLTGDKEGYSSLLDRLNGGTCNRKNRESHALKRPPSKSERGVERCGHT